MEIDLTTVIVAVIGLLSTFAAGQATRAGKKREQQLLEAAQEQKERDQEFEYMKQSREAAIQDAQRERDNALRFRAERDASDAHNSVLIQELVATGRPVPPRPKT